MELQEYFQQKKNLYKFLLEYIEESDELESNFQNLIQFIKTSYAQTSKEEFIHFLRLLSNVSNNHNKQLGFFSKIEKILQHFSNSIKQFLTNQEIFEIFKDNKRIILILFDQNVITVDSSLFINEVYYDQYCLFFMPEIKKLPQEEQDKFKFDFTKFEDDSNFDKKRRIGENDSYICSLIRQDSVEEFIGYVNQNNYSLSSTIKPSIFETNSFLIDKNLTLIEYSAFFGSLQILQYLNNNHVDLNPTLMKYAVHSKNPEMFQFLEENQIEPTKDCFLESIKCHHNDFAEFIQTNYSNDYDESVVEYSFRYYNYNFLPDDLTQRIVFFYLCKYNYFKMVDCYLRIKKDEIEKVVNIHKSIFQSNLKIYLKIKFEILRN